MNGDDFELYQVAVDERAVRSLAAGVISAAKTVGIKTVDASVACCAAMYLLIVADMGDKKIAVNAEHVDKLAAIALDIGRKLSQKISHEAAKLSRT